MKTLIVKFPPTKVGGKNREENIKFLQDALQNPKYLELIEFNEPEINTITKIISKDMIINVGD